MSDGKRATMMITEAPAPAGVSARPGAGALRAAPDEDGDEEEGGSGDVGPAGIEGESGDEESEAGGERGFEEGAVFDSVLPGPRRAATGFAAAALSVVDSGG
ncbi:hypothetical protein [Streptomyces anulatus]|uniref:hypothetical protein n=1 Tax=Streptomyces anulatus TaxID=1892 RepID=UPI0036DDCD88